MYSFKSIDNIKRNGSYTINYTNSKSATLHQFAGLDVNKATKYNKYKGAIKLLTISLITFLLWIFIFITLLNL